MASWLFYLYSISSFSAIFFGFLLNDYLKNKYAKIYAVVALLVIGLAEPMWFMVRNYPLFYVYFNPSSGGVKNALGNYELDYYLSFYETCYRLDKKEYSNWKNTVIVSNNGYQIASLLTPDTPQHLHPLCALSQAIQ